MELNLRFLEKYSCSGLYGLINEEDKKIDLRYTSNLINSIADLITKSKANSVSPKDLQRDFKKLDLVILEKDLCIKELQLKQIYWTGYYKELGYKLYRKYGSKTLKIETNIAQVPGLGNKYYFVVNIFRPPKKIIVGIFDSDIELNEFIARNYHEGVQEFVYSDNVLTTRYLELVNKKDMLEDVVVPT